MSTITTTDRHTDSCRKIGGEGPRRWMADSHVAPVCRPLRPPNWTVAQFLADGALVMPLAEVRFRRNFLHYAVLL
jgi:hypothetical protein